jgi:hypothetical protein
MSRIKIEDLPVMEELDQNRAKSISGGGDSSLEGMEEFENPLAGQDKGDTAIDLPLAGFDEPDEGREETKG